MAIHTDAEIISNVEVAEKIFKLTLDAPKLAEVAKAGQFAEIKLSDEFTLRRPLGIASTKNGAVKIFYRVVGRGTKFLSEKKSGDKLNIIGGLGNGFNTDVSGRILLVGGGMGLAPLLSAAEKLDAVDVIIGGKTEDEVLFWDEEFRGSAGEIFITTDDGSLGTRGFVTDILPRVFYSEEYSAVYACGPEVMMRGVALESRENHLPCYVSLERRMACGLGACLSCSVDTDSGRKKVCKDGPVFNAHEIFFDA